MTEDRARVLKAQELASDLLVSLGLDPTKIRKVVLTIEANHLPVLTVESIVRSDDGKSFKETVERFSLVPREDA